MKRRPLVALSSAAILTVYTAGYLRTRSAAERFAAEAAPRRAAAATPPRIAAPTPLPSLEAAKPAAPLPRRPAAAPDVAPAPSTAPPPEIAASPAPPPQAELPAPVLEPEPPPPAPLPEPAVETAFKDGTYLGWGSCRHGDIQASVVVEAGRITAATIARCLTRYSCSWIEHLPTEVVSRQSTEVDYVSGATESTDAFHDAVADALSKAK